MKVKLLFHPDYQNEQTNDERLMNYTRPPYAIFSIVDADVNYDPFFHIEANLTYGPWGQNLRIEYDAMRRLRDNFNHLITIYENHLKWLDEREDKNNSST